MCGKIIHLALLTALLILFCSCNDSQNPEALNFPGCSDGEVEYNSADSTYSLCQDGIWVTAPTSQRFIDVAPDKYLPDLNFTIPFTLQPPEPLEQGIVRCTFNGAEPDTTTPAFTENRLIDTTTVVRCTEFVKNQARQKQTETYFINESINMPVVSISVAPEYVKEYLDAAPCNPNPCYEAIFWEDVEYPTHVEYFANGSSSKEKDFEIDAGISITGNSSRNQLKKSVAITMRKKYQKGKLHYPLFEARPECNKFKAFILRNNGQRFISDYIEDATATSLLEGTNVDYQRSRMVVVFYNGLYRGIYDMREKANEDFIETNHNYEAKSITMLTQKKTNIDALNGSTNEYLNFMKYISNKDLENDSEAFDFVKKNIDIVNYMEYIAAQIYYHNNDWPQNNVKMWKGNNSPWRFVVFDTDMGFDWTKTTGENFDNENMIEWIQKGGRYNTPCATTKDYRCFHNIFVKQIHNATFKNQFINRSAYIYSTFINSTKINNTIEQINNSIDPYQIYRDQKTYKRPNYTNSCGFGFDPYGDCIKTWSQKRDQTVKKDFRESFNLDQEISISIKIKGNGRLKLDDNYVKQENTYNWTVFKNHPMQLTVECLASTKFKSWENGSTNANRVISPKSNSIFTAECEKL